ncbi:MAG TPA: T9SS type A sorting domain-containing protein, partial [Chitinispirillaceae bacterium]|nr:T9SS type A sorting domain-containing protein [Chitinispirillaceae bacterium]
SVNGKYLLKASRPITELDIFSLSGRLISRHDFSLSPKTSFIIESRGAKPLGRGLYLVRVKSVDGSLAVRKFTIVP